MFFSPIYDRMRHCERQHGGAGRLWSLECDLDLNTVFAPFSCVILCKLLDQVEAQFFSSLNWER